MNIKEIIDNVDKNMVGRIADPRGTEVVCETVVKANGGNYLEIGTLHGGTAIPVALTMKELGLEGHVYCVDPLNGYYADMFGKNKIDDESRVEVSRTVMEINIEQFGVGNYVRLVQKRSLPFPEELDGIRFSVSFIDGWHWDDVPIMDWQNVKEVTDKFVIFDNYGPKHPAVTVAVKEAMADPYWDVDKAVHILVVMKRSRA